MKTVNAALLIAAGIVLLWVITSNRTANLSGAWNTLVNGTSVTPVTTTPGTPGAASALPGLPALGATQTSFSGLPTDLNTMGLPTLESIEGLA